MDLNHTAVIGISNSNIIMQLTNSNYCLLLYEYRNLPAVECAPFNFS